MGTKKLTFAQKTYVVKRLAARDHPTTIMEALREKFGVTLTRQAITRYNPLNARGRHLDPYLKEMFAATRARVVAEQAEASAVAARLAMLEIEVQRALSDGNAVLAERLRQLIEREIARRAPSPTTALAPAACDAGCKPLPEPRRALTNAERARALVALVDRVKAEAEQSSQDGTPRRQKDPPP